MILVETFKRTFCFDHQSPERFGNEAGSGGVQSFPFLIYADIAFRPAGGGIPL